tara:strand:+ start:733 stop:1398 length:666 start_codon:yes stop_codon:yes gene_type:complete
MLELETITLVILSSIKLEKSIKALEYSCRDIKWGEVKFVSDTKPDNLPDFIQHEFCPKMSNVDEWNYAAIYELPKHIKTDYCMLIHDDGFVVNADSWREEFLDYDYIGAPWPLPQDDFSFRAKDGELIRVGNSVSLRSKKLLDLPINLGLEWKAFHGYYNEDGYICVNYRHRYLENGCKFATIDEAKYFSHETMIPEVQGIKPFAFHGHAGLNNIYPNYGK